VTVAPVFDEHQLVEYVTGQRWFGAKTRDVSGAHAIDTALLPTAGARLGIALVEIRFDTGTHENYQLLFAERDGEMELDPLGDPALSSELVHLMRAGTTVAAHDGTVEFRSLPAFASRSLQLGAPKRVDAEQSNTSLVFGDELIFKVYRRLEAGINPELELLRFLSTHGFEHAPELGGWYAYSGQPLDATLGILQAFIAGGLDGFDLALEELESRPDAFLERLPRLGVVTGKLHTVLGADADDPAFCPEEPSVESLALLTATIDEEIERIFGSLPNEPALEPIAGRKEDVRERLAQLTRVGSVGRTIRHHGDYHLGQTLWADEDWTIIDFEGEPARSLPERRRKRSPLRDVAGMLRSFAYVASAASIQRGLEPPADWEKRARAAFLDAYVDAVDPSLLPSGRDAVGRLLAIFELEKAVYELRYELNHRPDWVSIPVAGIQRLLEQEGYE
jgi:maltokinase